MSEFETHLKTAFEKKGLAPKSVSLYMKNLMKLNGGKPLTDFRFLEKPEAVVAHRTLCRYNKAVIHYCDRLCVESRRNDHEAQEAIQLLLLRYDEYE